MPIRVRIGRYGPFLQLGDPSGDGPRASLPEDLAPADLTLEKAIALLKAKAEGPQVLGADPAGQKIYVMHGRFGAYVQLGETRTTRRREKPRRASLGRDYSEESITLEDALKLLSLPRELGAADDGEVIVANVGRFGPYVKHGSEFRSLEADDDVYTITLERAKELLAKPKKSIRRAAPGSEGTARDRASIPKAQSRVKILDGRYGPYVTDGATNASLPKGTAPEALTMDDAVGLLAARAGVAKGPRKRRTRQSASPRKGRRKKGAKDKSTKGPGQFRLKVNSRGLASLQLSTGLT